MANKPFAIQGSTLTIGGFDLQAGSNGVVIPGVTQAANYKVEEVEGTDDQTYNDFPLDTDVYVVDAAIYNTIVANGSISAFGTYIGYTDDEGYIDKIEVDGQGTYTHQQATTAESTNMYVWIGTTGNANDRPLVPEDWVQVPFRPKMRAGEVESIGGGNANTGDLVFDNNAITSSNANDDVEIYGGDDSGDYSGVNLISREYAQINYSSTGEPNANDGVNNYYWVDEGGASVQVYKNNEGENDNYSHNWHFNTDGSFEFPDGTKQTTAYTGQSSGSGSDNSNIWVQTFVSNAPTEDFPQIATSVEYDADGNVIALFSHLDTAGAEDSRYFSVGKYTATGSKIWTVRFADGLNTDGWGLAVDSVDNWIYIAGQTDGGDYTYGVSTLTKIDGGNGSVEWSKIYDFGFASSSAVVDVDSDGNPVMVGYADNDNGDSYLTVTKVDKTNGNVTWTRKLDGQADEQAYGMAVGPAGEVVAIGYMDNLNYPAPYRTIVTLTATPTSDPDWTTDLIGVTVGGLTYDVTFAGGVPTFSNIVDTTGNRSENDLISFLNANQLGPSGSTNMEVRVGTTTGEDMSDRMLIVKYDSTGTIVWQKSVQFDAGSDCTGADADIDSNGNIYICGQYNIVGGGIGIALVKFNSSGDKQWSRRVTGNCQSTATSIVVGPDDKLYISGVNGDVIAETFSWVVAKYSLDGLVEWQRYIENTNSWTFAGAFFGPESGGSNIAVRQGYVALAGGFGDLAQSQQAYAAVLQVPDTGNVFAVGNWDFKAANLSGTLNGTASNIEVVNADLTDSDNALTVSPDSVTLGADSTNFLIGTVFTAPGGNDSLVNGAYTVTLGNTGTVTLPAGGTITEGYVTSNPTIQLTPANPDVASQKLVIKGGGNYNANDNGIGLNWYEINPLVGDTVEIYVNSPGNANQTLYWWIYPEGAGISDPGSGTVSISNSGTGSFSFTVDSDDYEFTVRVSPEDNNYNPANTGVETQLFNSSAPTFDADHHLHLTTGNLAETSIFLGTDNHNVRTNTDGTIQVTTTYYGAVASVASINSQGGYNTGTYTGLTTTGGTGSGLTVNATSNGGYIGVITVVNPGKGYTDDEVITLVGGDGFGCTFVINVPTGTSEWQFNTDGSITFPTLPTLDWDRRTLTGPTLQMGNDPTVSDAIITGPTPNQANPNAVRLIIQGQEGWGPGFGGGQAGGYEGGDVYIWAGHGGEGNDYSGNGGDVKLRGGPGGLNGGYIRLESGDANAANGYGGFLDLNAGNAYNTGGYGGSVNIRAGEGSGQGGAVNIHTATADTLNHQWTFAKDGILTFPDGTTNSGDTVISTSTYNIQSIGNTLIQTSANAGAKTWTFGADGRTTFPNGTIPEHSYGADGDKEGMVVFSDPYIYYCKQDFVPNSTNVLTLASSGSSVWVSSTDYAGDLVANFTANSTGWTYNGVTLINISVDNQFGPGYLLEGVTGFSTINGDRYTLESPNLLLDIWVRVAWTGTNW